MVDVRGVLLPFAAFVLLAAAVLAGVLAVNRHHAWAWRAVARSAGALTVAGVVAGIVVVLFFDAAFLAFHLVFFPQGNFSFDPRVARLTQLFPEQFWTETAIALALVTLLVSAGVALVAYRRASELDGPREDPPPGVSIVDGPDAVVAHRLGRPSDGGRSLSRPARHLAGQDEHELAGLFGVTASA